MAQIVLNIPNSEARRVVDALCKVGGYAGDPNDQQERNEFARRVVAQQVRLLVGQVEVTQARVAAQAEVVAPLDIT